MNKQIVFIVLLILISFGALFFIAGHGNSKSLPSNSRTKLVNLMVKNNKLISGPPVIQAVQGDKVTIQITTDTNGELHIHGYDIQVAFSKGKKAVITFTTDMAGRFPYEIENTKTEIGALEIQPI